MKKVAIITDSNSGIHLADGIKNLFIVPMPFTIEDSEYFEDVNLSVEEFYKFQEEDKKIFTSQPSPGDLTNLWENVLKVYDEIVYFPMSSALSSSYQTAVMLAKEFKGRVHVVDAKKISVTLKLACYEALKMVQNGKTAKEIKQYFEKEALNASIYLMVNTLKYLKRGGRITPVVAALGTLLQIKPILQIQGGKLDQFAKVLNINQAKQKLINAIRKDIETRFLHDYKEGNLQISVAHSNNREKAEEFAEEVKKLFPDIEFGYIDELSLSIACHTGPGVLALTVCKKLA